MPDEHAGEVRAGTEQDRAVLVAGLLAELGIREVLLESGRSGTAARERPFETRRTDLPGELLQLDTWRLVAGPLRLEGNRATVRWTTSDEGLAAIVRDAERRWSPPARLPSQS